MTKTLSAIALCSAVAVTAVYPQAVQEATIQPETRARLVLQTNLSSKLNEVGDTFTATLSEPVFADGQMVMARGTEFHGRVTAVSPAARPQRGATMTIVFDSVSMPWGEEPVAVMLTAMDDWSKDEKLKADDEGRVKGGHRGDETLRNVERGGRLGSMGAGAVILLGRATGAGPGAYGAGGGAIAGGMLAGVLMTKGEEVRVGSGTTFRIKFVKPMSLPIIRQPGAPRPDSRDNDQDDTGTRRLDRRHSHQAGLTCTWTLLPITASGWRKRFLDSP